MESLVSDYMLPIEGFKDYGNYKLKELSETNEYDKNSIRSDIAFNNIIASLNGKPAIDLEGTDLNDKTVKLSDFKGKITVVDFWATWCGPCRAEFPAYKKLEEIYSNDVNFVSVGVFCGEKEWNKMAKEEGFSSNIFISKSAADQLIPYEIQYIPRYLVLDESFHIIDANAPRP